MSDRVAWGVMGNATIARVCVIPAIQRSRNGVVRALASRRPDDAEELCRQRGIVRAYGAYEDLLRDPEIEAVYIPLPNHLHHPWTVRALAAGKHVLCEKPLACNAREAQAMVDAARSAERLLAEAFMYRHHPRSVKVRQLIQDGAIGAPHLIRAAFCFRMSDDDYHDPENARLSPDMGGGALLDVGCYGVSVARWLYDAEPTHAQCHAVYHPNGVDVHVAAVLDFGRQRLAVVEASFIAGLQQTYAVVGEDGAIDLPHDAFVPWDKDTVLTLRARNAEAGTETVIPGADEYQLMVEHFADAIRTSTSLDEAQADSIANMRALDALAAAAVQGATVEVPHGPTGAAAGGVAPRDPMGGAT